MCTTLTSIQTSALSSETALEAELGKDGLHYRTWKICHPPMGNDLFEKKMEGLNESITESHHSTVIMGRIKGCHQLHITVSAPFLFILVDKVNFFPCCWCGGGTWRSKRGAQRQGLGTPGPRGAGRSFSKCSRRTGFGRLQLHEAGKEGQKRKNLVLARRLETIWKGKYEPFPHKLHSLAVCFRTHKIAPVPSVLRG